MSGGSLRECSLCHPSDETVIWADDFWRVVRVHDADFPAYYRLITQTHVQEFSQLDAVQRERCTDALAAVESAVIASVHPISMNLAAFGNRVAHLHWHVVARFTWDSRFPGSLWEPSVREPDTVALDAVRTALPALDSEIHRALSARREHRDAAESELGTPS